MNKSIKYLYRCVLIGGRRIRNYKDNVSIIELEPMFKGSNRTVAVDLENDKCYIRREDKLLDPSFFPEYWR